MRFRKICSTETERMDISGKSVLYQFCLYFSSLSQDSSPVYPQVDPDPRWQQSPLCEVAVTQFSDLIVQGCSSMKLLPSCRAVPFAWQVKAHKWMVTVIAAVGPTSCCREQSSAFIRACKGNVRMSL